MRALSSQTWQRQEHSRAETESRGKFANAAALHCEVRWGAWAAGCRALEMKVIVRDTAAEAAAYAADIVVGLVNDLPQAALCLATGKTMEPLYRRLVSGFRAGRVSFARATAFDLDEYIGIAPDHPGSFQRYLREHFFSRVDFRPENTCLLRGDVTDPDAECQRYEALIRAHGGIDLQLLGIGRNGHIGFNEPGSDFASRTRVLTLSESTRLANASEFDGFETVPTQAMTRGIGSILEARECVLLATGVSKAPAVAAMIESPPDISCPASALQRHPRTTVVLDREAARGVTRPREDCFEWNSQTD